MALKKREPTELINLNKEMEGFCSNRSENSCDIKLDISRTPANDSLLSTDPSTRPLTVPVVDDGRRRVRAEALGKFEDGGCGGLVAAQEEEVVEENERCEAQWFLRKDENLTNG
ncbi:homeobox-leucine zipper ATHB-13-like [Olea europaea subsp. europaea]|uniref:Homeobox-leucine zipper ATHB-13-like n=1 Tax=Olea europaea subsp. europaea TaxID=158383 RepID=A0A8S0RE89_OLEEU|nr:homeobox-leucine zipper ATHB-13-like [Olea europaea subsp. europaea]